MNAVSVIAANDRLTYAEAAEIVASQLGPRPIVRVPSTYSYPGKSNAALLDEQHRMHAGITAREEWDRAVKRVMARPAVAEMHLTAGGR